MKWLFLIYLQQHGCMKEVHYNLVLQFAFSLFTLIWRSKDSIILVFLLVCSLTLWLLAILNLLFPWLYSVIKINRKCHGRDRKRQPLLFGVLPLHHHTRNILQLLWASLFFSEVLLTCVCVITKQTDTWFAEDGILGCQCFYLSLSNW